MAYVALCKLLLFYTYIFKDIQMISFCGVVLNNRLLNINVVKHERFAFNGVSLCGHLHREPLSDAGLYISVSTRLKLLNESGPGCSFCARCDGV